MIRFREWGALNRKFLFQNLMFGLMVSIIVGTSQTLAIHPSGEGSDGGMEHPSQPIPDNVLLPQIQLELKPDNMDGFNLLIQLQHFRLVPPLGNEKNLVPLDKNQNILQGHIHLFVNGKKKMRVYGEAVHIPSNWLEEGVNSLSASINNHQHGTYTFQGKEIQSTLLISPNNEPFIKNKYHWPTKVK